MMISYEFSILLAVLAFTYSYLLTRPHKLLNGFYNWLWKVFKSDERRGNGKNFHWLFMILIHCEQCVAGQIALWLFLAFNIEQYSAVFIDTLLTHALFTGFTIFCTAVIKGLYTKYIE